MTEKYTIGVGVTMDSKQQTSKGKIQQPDAAPMTKADSPFCIAMLGNFSGKKNHDKSIQQRRLIEVDRDNFEQLMAEFDIRLQLEMDDQQCIDVKLKELEDLHPDHLFDELDSFAQLRSLKRRLNKTSTFGQAALEIQGWAEYASEYAGIESSTSRLEENKQDIATDAGDAQGNLLDNILQSQQSGTNEQVSQSGQIDRLIKSIVAPYVEPAEDPRKDDLIAVVDKATSQLMRNILHHADFQELESTWLSLYHLVRRLETGKKLKLFILDMSREELFEDVLCDDIQKSALYKKFCDTTEGDLPWSVLLGNYQFSDSVEDILALSNLGAIAKQSNAPFLGSIHERMVGCQSLATTPDYEDWAGQPAEAIQKAWTLLRESPVADYIGLALPRFLLRQPYGEKASQVESFEFEEIDVNEAVSARHDSYLWGNAAILKTELLARGFLNKAWDMQPGEEFQIEKLPLHYYEDDGEVVNKPIAEIYLTEKAAEKMTAQGLMPVFSVRNMDVIRSSDFRSVSIDTDKIHGRWL